MSQHILVGTTSPTITPTKLGQHYIDTVNGAVYVSAGTSSSADWKISNALTTEQIQDAVGPMFTSSSTINASYNDVGNLIDLAVIPGGISHTGLSGIGTNTHAQIDTHLANTSNPHSTTKAQVGLGSVDNTSDLGKPISTATQTALNLKYDASNPSSYETTSQLNTRDTNNRARANHTGTQLAATISDFSTAANTALTTALAGKENTVTAGTITQYYRGDKSWQTLDKSSVGLSNVDNTSDLNKPVSNLTQTALNGKEPSVTIGTTTQYYRGDKSFQTLDKAAVGLSNVDNTSDASKPISTLTQTALNAKEATITAGTTAQYFRGDKSFQDFATDVRSAVLTGISFATNSAVLATDTLLAGLGKLQAQLTGHIGSSGTSHAAVTTSVNGFMTAVDKIKLDGMVGISVLKKTGTSGNSSNITFTDLTDLSVPVIAGNTYSIQWKLMYSTAVATTGISVQLSGTSSFTWLAATAATVTTGSTINAFPLTALNTSATFPSAPVASTTYLLNIEANVLCNTSGTFFPSFRSEVNGSNVNLIASSTAQWMVV